MKSNFLRPEKKELNTYERSPEIEQKLLQENESRIKELQDSQAKNSQGQRFFHTRSTQSTPILPKINSVCLDKSSESEYGKKINDLMSVIKESKQKQIKNNREQKRIIFEQKKTERIIRNRYKFNTPMMARPVFQKYGGPEKDLDKDQKFVFIRTPHQTDLQGERMMFPERCKALQKQISPVTFEQKISQSQFLGNSKGNIFHQIYDGREEGMHTSRQQYKEYKQQNRNQSAYQQYYNQDVVQNPNYKIMNNQSSIFN